MAFRYSNRLEPIQLEVIIGAAFRPKTYQHRKCDPNVILWSNSEFKDPGDHWDRSLGS